MIENLKKIVLNLGKINSQNKAVPIQKIKDQLKSINDFVEIMEEIDTKLQVMNNEDICEIAEGLFFIRSKLIDCETRFNDLIELIEQVVHSLDLSSC